MFIQKNGFFALALLAGSLVVSGCDKKEEPTPAREAPPPAASSAAAPTAGSAVKAFTVAEAGDASFLIDAPLEKIKGTSPRLRGTLQIDPAKLSATRGGVDVDLGAMKTHTFDDAEKNAKQTEHMQNWFELGNDVDKKQRDENQWARFTIKSVKVTGDEELAKVAEKDGARTVEITAEGDLWLHGVTAAKTVKLSVAFKGPADAPTEITVKTMDPIAVSLKEHDVKPRDLAGKFLQGSLEKIGQKIDDKAQVSLEFKAAPGGK